MKKIIKWVVIFMVVMVYIHCGSGKTTVPQHKPKHEVERMAINFINNVKNNVYADHVYFFQADTEFTTEKSKYYFRRLEKFIKNNQWNLYFTTVNLYDGYEDAADVILKAKSNALLVLVINYYHDTQQWELDAYEFPGLTYERPGYQSYDDYVKEIIANAKDIGVDYSQRETIEDEGTYYIEYH